MTDEVTYLQLGIEDAASLFLCSALLGPSRKCVYSPYCTMNNKSHKQIKKRRLKCTQIFKYCFVFNSSEVMIKLSQPLGEAMERIKSRSIFFQSERTISITCTKKLNRNIGSRK